MQIWQIILTSRSLQSRGKIQAWIQMRIIRDGVEKPTLTFRQSSTKDWFPNWVPEAEPALLQETHLGAFVTIHPGWAPKHQNLWAWAPGIRIFNKHPLPCDSDAPKGWGNMENNKKGAKINPQVLISVLTTVLTSHLHDPWYVENSAREAFVGMTGCCRSEHLWDSNPALLVTPPPTGARWESSYKF